MTDLLRIIYTSQPFGYDSGMLSGILLDARRCNQRDGLTGALVCRQDIFLQLLEGPRSAVEATYARIRRDDRHVDVKKRVLQPVSTRIFGQWAMHHDPAQTWFWNQAEVADGLPDTAGPEVFNRLFERLADQLRTGVAG